MSTVLRPNINRRSATQRPPTTASPTISRGLPSGGRPPSGLRSSSTVVDDRQAEDRRRLSSPIIVDWSIGHESGKKRWLQGLEPTTLGSQVKLLSHSAIVLILPILLVCAPFEAALADDSSTTRRRVDQQASAPRTSRALSRISCGRVRRNVGCHPRRTGDPCRNCRGARLRTGGGRCPSGSAPSREASHPGVGACAG